MGMVITLCLISFNVYNAIDGPPFRGLSYIEIWMIGTEFPIILAILEYIIILGYGRCLSENESRSEINLIASKVDPLAFFISLVYFIVFCAFYWCWVLSQI